MKTYIEIEGCDGWETEAIENVLADNGIRYDTYLDKLEGFFTICAYCSWGVYIEIVRGM